nr:hypothetical protein Iba_chr06cCG11390 [Ipomoea batatas]
MQRLATETCTKNSKLYAVNLRLNSPDASNLRLMWQSYDRSYRLWIP